MTTSALIVLDHAAALLCAVAWFAAGATAAAGRAELVRVLLPVALLVTALRVASVAVLAGRGWWFVQEKALFGLPVLVVASVAAALVAGPRLRSGARSAGRIGAAGVVALFVPAFAAVAGFAVTYFGGYPLTPGTALIAFASVVAGALLTERVLTTPSPDHPEPAPPGQAASGTDRAESPAVAPDEDAGAVGEPDAGGGAVEVSRRRFLGVAGGAVAVGAAGTGIGLVAWPGAVAADQGGGPGPAARPAVSVADLRGADTPGPGGVRREHVLTARKATVRLDSGHLDSGRDFDAWTFDGAVPGPPITANRGDLLVVKLVNHDVEEGVTLHWHGYDLPCGEDGAAGVTQEVVAPGGEFVHRFRADQVGTYWYHTHHASHVGVRRGLYGAFVVREREEPAGAQVDLTLPVHTFEGGVTVAGGGEHTAPPGTPVRLRLINTDSDPRRFTLAGTPFRVVAVDGRDLEQPGEVGRVSLHLPAGGRYDLVFTMPATPVALAVDGGVMVRLRPGADDASTKDADEDTSGWPELDLLTYGTPIPVGLRTDPADRHFTLVLDRGLAVVDGSPAYAQTVNGRGHPSIPDQLVTEGDTVRFTVVNRSRETHPWHLHGHPVLVLSRDGRPSTGSPLWVDTFDVRPGEVWEVAFRATNPGIWMNHCHNLPHVHEGMMLQLRYDGVTSPFGGRHAAGSGHGH
ncbi:multicopper oxidase family protein [Actinosynnema sp. NPDC050436]|uniref:multicopper oxidase family protein n=1 Tax=Actinosynnema sp. NPDC050436 TaxID=3155659 RepID=UPI0033F8E293